MRRWLIIGAVTVVVVGGATGGALWVRQNQIKKANSCLFPAAIQEQVSNLTLFCPNPKRLPKGMSADLAGASAGGGAVIYIVHDGAATISISQQKQPTDSQLNTFTANVIPLYITLPTALGTARIGATQNQSLASLPTKQQTWMLVATPKNYSIDRLSALLKSLQPSS